MSHLASTASRQVCLQFDSPVHLRQACAFSFFFCGYVMDVSNSDNRADYDCLSRFMLLRRKIADWARGAISLPPKQDCYQVCSWVETAYADLSCLGGLNCVFFLMLVGAIWCKHLTMQRCRAPWLSRIELFTGLAPGLCHLEANLSNVCCVCLTLRVFGFPQKSNVDIMENGHEHHIPSSTCSSIFHVQHVTVSTCSSHNCTDSFLFISLSC